MWINYKHEDIRVNSEETGLYYLRARYYDPETGRFISQDNISYLDPEHLGGLNLYAYCNDNPIGNIDPNGHAILTTLLIVTIAGAIIGGIMGGASYAMSTPTDDFKWNELGSSVLGGVVSGAVSSLVSAVVTMLTGNPMLSYAIGGAVGSIVGSLTEDGIKKQDIWSNVYWKKEIVPKALVSGFLGAITGRVFGQVGPTTTIIDEQEENLTLIKEKTKMIESEFEDLKQKMAKDIMRFLHLHTRILKKNHNEEIYQNVREMRIRHTMKVHGCSNYDEVAEVVDRLCDCEIQWFTDELIFDQEALEFFRPGADQGEERRRKMELCLADYKIKSKNRIKFSFQK